MSDFVTYYLSDDSGGHFERYIITTPSFFV
jgi:hypothetical protein